MHAIGRYDMALFIQDHSLGQCHPDTMSTLGALERALSAERDVAAALREDATNRVVKIEYVREAKPTRYRSTKLFLLQNRLLVHMNFSAQVV